MYALEIHLTRIVTPYLLNVYLPTGIFTIMSWVSFIIPVDIIAARVALLVTLILVLINIFTYVTYVLLKYVPVCFFFRIS